MMINKNILEIGAGQSPDLRATETLDIRDDLDHIDCGGVDVESDRLPLEADSVDLVVANHVIEHVSGEAISHLFMEIDRVVRSGSRFHAVTPHMQGLASRHRPDSLSKREMDA